MTESMGEFDEDAMLDRVLAHEGGISDDPVDRANAGGFITNRGITRESYAAYHRCDPEWVTNDDLRALTAQDARDIAARLYYVGPGIDLLPKGLCGAVCDAAFNMGPGTAIRMLQRIVGTEEDGIIGPVTVNHCHAYEIGWVLDKFCNARIAQYEKIVDSRPSQERFLDGWVARAESWRNG